MIDIELKIDRDTAIVPEQIEEGMLIRDLYQVCYGSTRLIVTSLRHIKLRSETITFTSSDLPMYLMAESLIHIIRY